MSLLLEVAHYRVAAEVPRLQDLLNFSQILLLESQFEQVVCIVDFLLDELALTIEGKNQIFHEKGHIMWFIQGFEGP